jgi:preprotein translocase subunit SecA
MNIQREAIYKKRQHALNGERLAVDINSMLLTLSQSIVEINKGNGDFDSFREESIRVLGIDPEIHAEEFKSSNMVTILDLYQDQVFNYYQKKFERISEVLLPIVKNVHQNEGNRYKRISIPFTDGGAHPLSITADLETAVKSSGKSIKTDVEKAITLAIIDDEWMEHLRNMDELKDSVQSASFEQKDPLVIYKMEAFKLFQSLIAQINEKVSSYLLKGTVVFQDGTRVEEARVQKTDLSKVSTNRTEEAMRQAAVQSGAGGGQKVETFKRTDKKIGRNDPCPCGSGKKYKQCHGKDL